MNEFSTVETGAPLVAPAANSPDLEVKDAQLIFGAVWRELEGEFGRSKMRFPRELILLGGHPAQAKVLTPTSSAWCAASMRRLS
jgi:adenylate kinase